MAFIDTIKRLMEGLCVVLIFIADRLVFSKVHLSEVLCWSRLSGPSKRFTSKLLFPEGNTQHNTVTT